MCIALLTYYFYTDYRKGGLLLNSFVGIGGACLMGLTKYFNSYEVLFIGRFIIGVNCGMKIIIKYLLFIVYYFNESFIVCFNN